MYGYLSALSLRFKYQNGVQEDLRFNKLILEAEILEATDFSCHSIGILKKIQMHSQLHNTSPVQIYLNK